MGVLGDYPFAMSLLFLFVSVVLLAQASITVYTYNKDNRARDLNYYWSCMVLIISIIATLISMFSMYSNRPVSAPVAEGTEASAEGQPLSAKLKSVAAQSENVAAAAKARANAATNAAKAVTVLEATKAE
jgi:hypothetical protein